MNDRRPFTITCVRRDPEHGHWTAHVTAQGGRTVTVDRAAGSWQAGSFLRGNRRDVHPEIAAALQRAVRRLEYRERNGTAPATRATRDPQLALAA